MRIGSSVNIIRIVKEGWRQEQNRSFARWLSRFESPKKLVGGGYSFFARFFSL
jgi:hypothetical protein